MRSSLSDAGLGSALEHTSGSLPEFPPSGLILIPVIIIIIIDIQAQRLLRGCWCTGGGALCWW